ncbi:DUF899 family protein [Bradyrhizobium erythrophlei]|uniref:DUF899 family protein n=1 Tax=Bradyrhizobium erythrophlei TaxID=1437360 RepID=UPI0035E61B22
MKVNFPNESSDYRAARDALLKREIQLRREMEAVAAELRALPPGGEMPEDYLFDCVAEDGGLATISLSGLFRDSDTLMLYHFMFPRHAQDTRPGPSQGRTAALALADGPCPSCTALIESWDSMMPHFEGLGGNLAVVARAPIEQVAAFARERGWKHIRLLSGGTNHFRRDYGGDGADGQSISMLTVFKRWPDGKIRLHWASEMIHAPRDPGQDPRHLGTVEPFWTLFDLTPAGRPSADEQIEYPCHCDDRGREGGLPPAT